jgi:hypothetical protein
MKPRRSAKRGDNYGLTSRHSVAVMVSPHHWPAGMRSRERAGETEPLMNKRETFEPAAARKQDWRVLLATLAPAIAGIRGVILADIFQQMLFSNLNNYPLTVLLFVWLFGTMMWCAFSVVRHAEAVAEPYGTLVLTLSVIIIEVALLASIMLHGENNPTLARDAMFATLMIVLNGMVGTALLMGALRYWEQEYNPAGARAFLVVIASLAVFALIIPNYTKTEPRPESGADEGSVVRLHHHPVLCRVRHHSDGAAQGVLCRTFA